MIGIIPAAGKGTRFKELGKLYSKTILPYNGKPLLIHQIEYMESHGIADIRVVLGHQAEETEKILAIYGKKPKIVIQKEQAGLSHAIFCALDEKDEDSVLIVLGDILPQDHLDFKKDFISYQTVPDFSRWCMAKEIDGTDCLEALFDKPQEDPKTHKALSGIYFFKKSNILFDEIRKQIDNNERVAKEFQISTAIVEYNKFYPILLREVAIKDFGTLEEYLANRNVSSSRCFNTILEKDNCVTKSSTEKGQKILDEWNWFTMVPEEIKTFCPKIYSFKIDEETLSVSYKMEKVFAPTLRELFLFLDSSKETWTEIFNAIDKYLDCEHQYKVKNDFLKAVVEKTESRVNKLPDEWRKDITVQQFLNEFKREASMFEKSDFSLMHGDFCFSNIFYDFTKKQIYVIDPRGQIFGSKYYEYAKLMHSALYDYDFIDAELYIKTDNGTVLYNNGKDEVRKVFEAFLCNHLTRGEIRFVRLVCASLFLSMIPLHSHNETNQKLYFETFKKIYEECKNG